MRRIFFSGLVAAVLLGLGALATVTSTTSTVTYASGSSTYSVPFKFLSANDLVVVSSTLGTLSLTTDYTVSGAGSATGGSITLTGGASTGTITITRIVPLTQPTNFRAQGSFVPSAHENAFDRTTMQIQQLQNQVLNIATGGDGGSLIDLSGLARNPVLATGSTTPRTLEHRFAEVKNILDYGAVCNGTTDDSAAIQAAVTAALAVPNGAVYIPPSANGCVLPTSGGATNQINVTGPISIYGAGPSSTIYIKGSTWKSGGNTGYFQVSNGSSTISNISFHDFRFVGDYPFTTGAPTGPSGGQGAIIFGSSSGTLVVNNGVVTRMTFEKLGGPGVQWNGGGNDVAVCCQAQGHIVSDSLFINSGSRNDQVNPFSGGSVGTIISGNTFKDISHIAIEWSGMGAVITGNYFDNVLYSPIAVESASAQSGWNTIANNVIKNSGFQGGATTSSACIQLGESQGAYHYRVINNVMSNCAGSGIVLAGSTGATDIDIEGNYIDCAGWKGSGRTDPVGAFAGIGATGRTRVRVVNNHVRACTGGSDASAIGIAAGAGTDNWVDGNSTSGTFTDRSFYLPSSIGSSGAGTRSYVGRNFDMTAGKVRDIYDNTNNPMVPAFTINSATPDVGGYDAWRTNNSNPTAITFFNNGYLGQTFTLQAGDSNTTLTQGAQLVLRNGVTRKMVINEVTQFYLDQGFVWREVPSFSAPTSLFANLGSPSNGTMVYCSDCLIGTNPCAGSGNGAFAERLNGVWVCGEGNTFTGPGSAFAVRGTNSGTGDGVQGVAPSATAPSATGSAGAFAQGTGSGYGLVVTSNNVSTPGPALVSLNANTAQAAISINGGSCVGNYGASAVNGEIWCTDNSTSDIIGMKSAGTVMYIQAGTKVLGGGTGVVTVFNGTHACTCTNTTANLSVQCAVVGANLTINSGAGADTIAYNCW